ncbi:MAG: MoaD/ThiS family protein [Pirellulales bacterium]
MKVNIRLFAVARELAGRDSIALDVSPGTTIGQLRARLAAEIPDLAPVLPHVLFAVGSEYARDDQPISDGSQIACIPPVSGG